MELWEYMPQYVKLRTPTKVFESASDGYNLSTMYTRCLDYLEEEGDGVRDSYHFSLMIIHTKSNHIFGAFITAVPLPTIMSVFKGTFESFVFRIEGNEVETFQHFEEDVNKFYLQSHHDYLAIGSGMSGSSIRLDKDLFNGSSNSCETFGSPILMRGATKNLDDMFEAKNFEIFIL